MSPSPSPESAAAAAASAKSGFFAAVAAYGVWGVSPLFFKLLSAVPPIEVVAHRVLWALVVLAVVLTIRRGWHDVLGILSDRRKLLVFVGSATAITINWVTFVHAVTSGHALEASLGYYIFPLVTVLLAAVFLKETFNRRQAAALGLVVAGVAALVIGLGTLPWVALTLAVSFGIYGLLRKTAPAESLVGLFVETLVLMPLVLLYLGTLEATGAGSFLHSDGWAIPLLLAAAGPLTAVPLFLFAFAARRLRLATLGLMQYMNPTMQFLLATLVFHETFTVPHAVAFVLIWSGIAVYSLDPAKLRRSRRRAGQDPVAEGQDPTPEGVDRTAP